MLKKLSILFVLLFSTCLFLTANLACISYPRQHVAENDNTEKFYIKVDSTLGYRDKTCHKASCPMITFSKTAEISIFAALDLDYMPCEVCNPELYFFPSHNELTLLDHYRQLSPTGKDLLIKYSKGLLKDDFKSHYWKLILFVQVHLSKSHHPLNPTTGSLYLYIEFFFANT